MRRETCREVAAVDVAQLLLFPCVKLTISCQMQALCCLALLSQAWNEEGVGLHPVLSTICLLHQQPNCQPISNCTVLISRVGQKGQGKQCWTERCRWSFPTAGEKIFYVLNGANSREDWCRRKKNCLSSHGHFSDCNLMFKINPAKEGLIPSQTLELLFICSAAAKTIRKNIHGRKCPSRYKVEAFV